MNLRLKPALALGTVQFGLPYGITNEVGQVPESLAATILATAKTQYPGIILDTAPGYGNSEEVLGRLIAQENFRIVTKTNTRDPDIRRSFSESLNKLNRSTVYGLLDHNATFLLGSEGAAALSAMRKLKEEGLIQKIGATIYNGDEWDRINKLGSIDLIQIPMNVLDQRLLRSGHLQRMKEKGAEIHIRSAFLQGLLLVSPDHLPVTMNPYKSYFKKFTQFCSLNNLTLIQGALAFLKQQKEIDQLVIGATSVEQWNEIVEAYNTEVPDLDWNPLSCGDPVLLNPAHWPKGVQQ